MLSLEQIGAHAAGTGEGCCTGRAFLCSSAATCAARADLRIAVVTNVLRPWLMAQFWLDTNADVPNKERSGLNAFNDLHNSGLK